MKRICRLLKVVIDGHRLRWPGSRSMQCLLFFLIMIVVVFRVDVCVAQTENPRAFFDRGLDFYEKKDYRNAALLLKEGLSIRYNAIAAYYLAKSLLELGDVEQALTLLEAATPQLRGENEGPNAVLALRDAQVAVKALQERRASEQRAAEAERAKERVAADARAARLAEEEKERLRKAAAADPESVREFFGRARAFFPASFCYKRNDVDIRLDVTISGASQQSFTAVLSERIGGVLQATAAVRDYSAATVGMMEGAAEFNGSYSLHFLFRQEFGAARHLIVPFRADGNREKLLASVYSNRAGRYFNLSPC